MSTAATRPTGKADFNFWVPLEIKKGKDKKGKEVMRLGGIASTFDKDDDDEFLDPKGFDTTYLMTHGLVNWHHGTKDKPKTIIGEPTKAEITKKGLYTEVELYPDSQTARDVWELANILKKNSKTRRLGFSIEGKATERDPLNKKIITKAVITGMAVTHMPKNHNTVADVLKGHTDELFKALEFETENKDNDGDGGETNYIIDIETGGHIIKLSDKGEIVIKSTETEKALTTASGAALIPEHVDRGEKDLTGNKVIPETFTKAEVYNKIFSDFSAIEISKAQKIYQIIIKTAEMSNKKHPTEDDINKAYGVLGIKEDGTAVEEEVIEKAEASDEEPAEEVIEKAEEPVAEEPAEEVIEKAEASDEPGAEEVIEKAEGEEGDDNIEKGGKGKAYTYKMHGEGDDKHYRKMMKGGGDKMEYADKTKYEKGDAGFTAIKKGDAEEGGDPKGSTKETSYSFMKMKGGKFRKMIAKGGELSYADKKTYIKKGDEFHLEDSTMGSISKFQKGQDEILEALQKSEKENNEIKKAMGTVLMDIATKNDEFQKSITGQLDEISKGSNGRRSINSTQLERNFDQNDIEKAKKDGKIVLSKAADKIKIANVLEMCATDPIQKGGTMDESFEKATTVFESSGFMSDDIARRLDMERNVIIVD